MKKLHEKKLNRNILYLLLGICFLFAPVSEILAIPAYPGRFVYTQSDNTIITINKYGDEWNHVTVTTDGYPLVFNAQTRNYEYARIDGTRLSSTGIPAHDADERHSGETSSVSKIEPQEFLATTATTAATVRHAPSARRIRISDVPTTGHQKAIVLLVNFTNSVFSMPNPKEYYSNMLNQEGFTNGQGATGSARDFYVASSDGKYAPEFVVVGPVTVSKVSSYYSGSDGTTNAYLMVQEAVKLAADSVDFTEFDTDHDGYVDNVYVFYAGYGMADSNKSGVIWPHAWNLSEAGAAVNIDGVTVDRYACSQEINGQDNRTAGIGTFVHEFGHVLGLGDHYNTRNSNAYAFEEWDTMSGGSYNNNQNTPPLFSAFEREELGWLTPEKMTTATSGVQTLRPLAYENRAFRVNIDGLPDEYFLLENRQQKGWDSYLPGHGMLVWHVRQDSAAWLMNNINVTPSNYHLTIVPADSMSTFGTMSADPFPGSDNITRGVFYDHDDEYIFGINNVTEINGNVSFNFLGNNIDLPSPEPVEVNNIMGTSATVAWHRSENAAYYRVILKQGTTNIDDQTITGDSVYRFTGLKPETQYDVEVFGGVGRMHSDTATVSFTTLPLQYSEKRVSVLNPTMPAPTSLTAHWKALEGTLKYIVTLYSHSLTGHGSTTCAFTQKAADIPAGWSTSCTDYVINLYGNEPYSMKMNHDGDWLKMAEPGVKYTGLRFWQESSYDANTLSVETATAGRWTTLQTFTTRRSIPDIINVDIPSADSVRIRANISHYQIVIDDVTASYLCDTLNAARTVETTNLEYTFTGLKPDSVYSYTVLGVNGNDTTLVSDTITVTLNEQGIPSSVSTVSVDVNSPVEVYDLSGHRMPSGARLPKGIYIERRGATTIKKTIR